MQQQQPQQPQQQQQQQQMPMSAEVREAMASLAEMGFTDVDSNLAVLQKHSTVAAALDELLGSAAPGGAQSAPQHAQPQQQASRMQADEEADVSMLPTVK